MQGLRSMEVEAGLAASLLNNLKMKYIVRIYTCDGWAYLTRNRPIQENQFNVYEKDNKVDELLSKGFGFSVGLNK